MIHYVPFALDSSADYSIIVAGIVRICAHYLCDMCECILYVADIVRIYVHYLCDMCECMLYVTVYRENNYNKLV